MTAALAPQTDRVDPHAAPRVRARDALGDGASPSWNSAWRWSCLDHRSGESIRWRLCTRVCNAELENRYATSNQPFGCHPRSGTWCRRPTTTNPNATQWARKLGAAYVALANRSRSTAGASQSGAPTMAMSRLFSCVGRGFLKAMHWQLADPIIGTRPRRPTPTTAQWQFTGVAAGWYFVERLGRRRRTRRAPRNIRSTTV